MNFQIMGIIITILAMISLFITPYLPVSYTVSLILFVLMLMFAGQIGGEK